MSTTGSNPPETFSPPPRNTAPVGNTDGPPRSSSLYLFTFLSTLFLLLVVSTAIVLRSFLLRRRYRMGLQETLDDILRQPGDLPGASRGRNFGVKPKLWDTRVKLGGQERSSVNELADIKPLAVVYVPRGTTKPMNLPSTSHEQSSAFLNGLFAHPLPLPRHRFENDCPGGDSPNSSAEIPRTVQVSVVISMPTPIRRKPPASENAEEEFPNVAFGFIRLPIVNE